MPAAGLFAHICTFLLPLPFLLFYYSSLCCQVDTAKKRKRSIYQEESGQRKENERQETKPSSCSAFSSLFSALVLLFFCGQIHYTSRKATINTNNRHSSSSYQPKKRNKSNRKTRKTRRSGTNHHTWSYRPGRHIETITIQYTLPYHSMTPSDLAHQPNPHPPALPVSALDQDNDIDIPDADDVEDLKIAAAHKRQDSFSSQARSHSRSSSIGGASFGSIEEDNTGTSPFCRCSRIWSYTYPRNPG